MKKLQYKGISILVYTDEQQYVNDYFDLPPDAVLDVDSLPESAGFADIDGNEIAIYKNKIASFDDLLSTVAHEMGHLITGGYSENPPREEGYDELHEAKAEHYETFTVDAYQVSKMIYADTF